MYEVFDAVMNYDAEVRHDGRTYAFEAPGIIIPTCKACGEQVFTGQVDRQVRWALRLHLGLLTPQQIRDRLGQLGLTQKDVSDRLGIAEATMSRWLNESQIQSKAMDRLMRLFLGIPSVRLALPNETHDPDLGLNDADYDCGSSNHQRDPSGCERSSEHASWPANSDQTRDRCRLAQEVLQNCGSTWGPRSAEAAHSGPSHVSSARRRRNLDQ